MCFKLQRCFLQMLFFQLLIYEVQTSFSSGLLKNISYRTRVSNCDEACGGSCPVWTNQRKLWAHPEHPGFSKLLASRVLFKQGDHFQCMYLIALTMYFVFDIKWKKVYKIKQVSVYFQKFPDHHNCIWKCKSMMSG